MTSEPWYPIPPPEPEGEKVPAHVRPARTMVVRCADCGTHFNPADRTCPRCGRQTQPTDPRGFLVALDGDDSAGTDDHNRRAD